MPPLPTLVYQSKGDNKFSLHVMGTLGIYAFKINRCTFLAERLIVETIPYLRS